MTTQIEFDDVNRNDVNRDGVNRRITVFQYHGTSTHFQNFKEHFRIYF